MTPDPTITRTRKSGWAFDAPLDNPGRYDPETGVSLMALHNNPELAKRLARHPRWKIDFSKGAQK
jgi:hypothetical protein